MSFQENTVEFRQHLPVKEQELNPRRATAVAIINPEGKILLGHRTTNLGDDWVMPGGADGIAETFDAAAQREVTEQTGIRFDTQRNNHPQS